MRRRRVAAGALTGGLLAAGALLARSAETAPASVPLAQTMPAFTAPAITVEPVAEPTVRVNDHRMIMGKMRLTQPETRRRTGQTAKSAPTSDEPY